MFAKCRTHLSLFNPDWVWEAKDNIEIVEDDENGLSIAKFQVGPESIVLKSARQAPLIWSLLERKCADGAIITFKDGQVHAHLVELKGNISVSTMTHALSQFRGMFLTALGISRLLGIEHFDSVTCYIAGKSDKITDASENTSTLALLKTPVGKSKTFGGVEAWWHSQVELPYSNMATLVKGWKSEDGVADFGFIG